MTRVSNSVGQKNCEQYLPVYEFKNHVNDRLLIHIHAYLAKKTYIGKKLARVGLLPV